jgi:hypothetical protein
LALRSRLRLTSLFGRIQNRQQGLVYLGPPYMNDTTQQGSDFILGRVFVNWLAERAGVPLPHASAEIAG